MVKYVVWASPVYLCNMYCTMCWCCLGPRCPCIQIDAADLIKPVGLHVECQHCHQAQWEPNGGIGRIDPVDSTASAQSRNQRPLRSKAMILSWEPLPGRKGRWRQARQRQRARVGWGEGWAREEEGLWDPKISKRSRKRVKMLEEQVAVGKSGQHTASIWVFLCSQLRGDARLVFTAFFLSQRKVKSRQRLFH